MRRTVSLAATLLAVCGLLLPFVDAKDKDKDKGEVEIKGMIEALPTGGLIGDWKVAGKTVHVSSATRIEQHGTQIAIGAIAEVKGSARTDGSIDASKIEIEEGPGARVEFKGTIERLPATGLLGDWVVSGRTVHVSSLTRIEQHDGLVAVGAMVEVEGQQRPDGSVDATKIEVEEAPGEEQEVEFKGFVEQLPASGIIGDWIVSGKTVHVTASTRIQQERGVITVGAFVEVEGTRRADGSIDAAKIQVEATPGAEDKVQFTGTVESLPSGLLGDWRVSGRTVHVTADTKIKQGHGVLGIGTRVQVKGVLLADGAVTANKIKVRNEDDD
ncbi:MAG TPA: DUF5666 domain-containing protein [Blastocatellia bacterium]|nr:DUF5666 domain-containing protein [Blastocatellia bacterium]